MKTKSNTPPNWPLPVLVHNRWSSEYCLNDEMVDLIADLATKSNDMEIEPFRFGARWVICEFTRRCKTLTIKSYSAQCRELFLPPKDEWKWRQVLSFLTEPNNWAVTWGSLYGSCFSSIQGLFVCWTQFMWLCARTFPDGGQSATICHWHHLSPENILPFFRGQSHGEDKLSQWEFNSKAVYLPPLLPQS